MKKLFKSKTFLGAVLSIALCASLIAGATFAIFTSESKVNIAVTSGTVKVTATVSDLNATSPEKITSEGTVAGGYVAGFTNGGSADYNGNEITLTNVTPGDKVTFNITVKNESTVKVQYRTRVVASEDNGLFGALKIKIGDYTGMGISAWEALEVNSADKVLACEIELPTTAADEYQGKACKIAFTVEAVQGNAETVNDTAYYTLEQFNALTEIPEGIKNVYLNIGRVSLKDGDVTIGNKNICDIWTWDRDTNHTAGEILEDGRKVYMVRDTDTIYSSNKPGINLYISGSVNENPEGGLNQSNSHVITLSVPDASNVVFTEGFTVNGYFRMNTGWSDGRNLGGAVYNRTVKTVLFDHSTFNGIWIQNGGFFTDGITLDGCTFNAYENKVSANDSNPLWFCNIRTCDVTVTNCTFKASRPIKVVEQGVFGANVNITNNKFDMSLTNSADDASTPKNVAIMFSTLIGETQWNPAGTLGNVVVSGNTVTNATALLTFFNPSQITMKEGATFTVANNTLNSAKLSVGWKTANEYKPDFVEVK